MAERYTSMRSLRDHLEKLFRLCGLDEQRVEVKMPPRVVIMVENLFRDYSLCNFLDALDEQAALAVKALNDRQLDVWSSEETERRLEEVEAKLAGASQKQKELEQKLLAAENKNEEYIRNMIAMRDNLLMRRDWIKENEPEDVNAGKLVENQLRETANLLKKSGVEILEDDGMFDSSRHTVVETRETDDPLLDNQIAEVFRPGYVYQGNVLRGQEVIIYMYQPPVQV